MPIAPHIHSSWKNLLHEEFQKPYFAALKAFLVEQKEAGKTIYPSGTNIFRAFDTTPWDQVRVVILGQDPYHGEGQANGLAFSVPEDVAVPPSLKNMYKEISHTFPNNDADIFRIPYRDGRAIGDLTSWAEKGVLLLNAVLTVEANNARSHQGKGREQFTDAVISRLNEQKSGLVFLLRGNDARKKRSLIDTDKHHVLETTHPSPLSAYRGFLGSGCFQQAEKKLNKDKRRNAENSCKM